MRRPSPLLFAALLASTACGGAEERPRHNVLLITLDTTRADRLGCYGYDRAETTPHIDRLAREGVRFERAVSTAGLTPMAHASLLTGLNNYRHGLRTFYSEETGHRLDEEVATLAEILAARGYRTGAMVSSYPVSEIYGLDRGFETFVTGLDVQALDLTGQQRHEEHWYEGERTATQRRGDTTVDDAIAWLEEGGDERPWFLWVHLFDVHDYSIVPPIEWARPFGIEAYDPTVSGQDHQWRDRMYDPELRFMDAQIGRLFDRLRERGEYDGTITVLTSDHGQGLLDGLRIHGWGKHRLLYDWSVRVPLIVRIPGERQGVSVAPQVRSIDVMPTVLAALDIGSPQVEGAPLLELMRGGSEAVPRLAYADALNLVDAHSPKRGLPPISRDNLFMVSDGRWKLIWHQQQPENHELFDLQADPWEERNLAHEHPAEVERLARFLEERQATRLEKPEQASQGPDADLLHGLGYTGGDDEDGE